MKLLNLVLRIDVSINVEGIRFWVIVNGKYSFEINLYNYYILGEDFKKNYESFNPELCCSSYRIKFDGKKTDEELTLLKLTNLLATELENHYTENVGSNFITRLIECFTAVRLSQKTISEIHVDISTIEREVQKALDAETEKAFNESFKEDNWYHLKYNSLHVETRGSRRGNYEVYFHIKKISAKISGYCEHDCKDTLLSGHPFKTTETV